MEFSAFATVAARLESGDSEDDTQDILTSFFQDILEENPSDTDSSSTTEELAIAARLFEARLFPGWDDTTLDISPSFIYRVIARGAGNNTSANDVEEKVSLAGGIGQVAGTYTLTEQQNLRSYGETAQVLSLTEVYTDLHTLANTPDSRRKQREDLLFGLLIRATPKEAEYIVRIALSEHHLGITDTEVKTALGAVFNVSKEVVDAALQVSNDYKQIAQTAETDGRAGLVSLNIELGRPIKPMRAHTGSISNTVKTWKQVAVEPKYDGARVQIHYDGIDTVHVFSRNMNDITALVPEVTQFVQKHLETPAILDGELVAFDDEGKSRGLQSVLQRLRQDEPQQALERTTPVTFIAFDCLFIDGTSLLDTPLRERYEVLWKEYPHKRIAGQSLFSSTSGIADYEAKLLGKGYEGLMLKNPNSTYTPGKRSGVWVKIKPDSQTIDLVITGGEFENESESALMKSFLVAVRGPSGFKSIGKISKGLSEADRETLTQAVQPYVRSRSGTAVSIQPAVVIEVGYETVSESMKYTSGFKLDIPRFVEQRNDKTIQQADTLQFAEDLAETHTADTTSSPDPAEVSDTDNSSEEDDGGESVSRVGLGDDDVRIVERTDDSDTQDADDDDDDDEDGSERIYAG